uniref:Uncharacterized protein n=1 Tax=Leersia perrieri TaxID=77586 RepID=A0A0D9XSD0_9ORYZ
MQKQKPVQRGLRLRWVCNDKAEELVHLCMCGSASLVGRGTRMWTSYRLLALAMEDNSALLPAKD